MKLTLGPIPFLWEKERVLSFYEEIAATPVSVVYVGEVICNKRSLLGTGTVERIGRMLQDAGKEVVISTLGLVTTQEELDFIEDLCKLPYPVEANNIGVLNFCSGKETIAGPHIAIYNAPTAKFLAHLGVKRIVFMPELSREAIGSIASSLPSLEKEIIGFGHLPLAFSWRCYTARALDLSKSNCAIVCKKYPGGMPLETMDGMPIFNINGTQLMSAQKVCMIEQLDILKGLGIDYLRIVPQEQDTMDVIGIFSKAISGTMPYTSALEALKRYAPEGIGNGWFYGQPGWEYINEKSASPRSGQATQLHIQDHPR